MYDDGPIWLRRGGQHAMDARISRENMSKIAPKRKPTQRSADEEKTRENRNMGQIGDAQKAQVELEGFFGAELPHDPVDHPAHYTSGPICPHCGSRIECIVVTEKMDFCLGNAVKYIWRHADKGNPMEDLKKARWYIDREIARMESK